MIPYEDLVSALTMWRERNGLPTGASDYLGEPPAPEPVSFAAYERRPGQPEAPVELDEVAVDEVAVDEVAVDDFDEVPVDIDAAVGWGSDEAMAEGTYDTEPPVEHEHPAWGSEGEYPEAEAEAEPAADIAYDAGEVAYDAGEVAYEAAEAAYDAGEVAYDAGEVAYEAAVDDAAPPEDDAAIDAALLEVSDEGAFESDGELAPDEPVEPLDAGDEQAEATHIGVEPAADDEQDPL